MDSIITLSEAYGDPESSSSLNDDLLAWHHTTSATYTKALDKQRLTYSNPADAFARTLLVDDTYTGANACQTTTPISDPVSTHTRAFSLETPGSPVWLGNRTRRDEVSTFRLQLMAAGSGRRFAITQKGRMGLVPWCAEAGDSVCVVSGSSVLFVVRRGSQGFQEEDEEKNGEKEYGETRSERKEVEKEYQGKKDEGKEEGNLSVISSDEESALTKETWTLIGDAYVHGLMNGEALSQNGLRTREMVFCWSEQEESLTQDGAGVTPSCIASKISKGAYLKNGKIDYSF